MDNEQVKKRAEELCRMTPQEFRRDCELRNRERKHAFDGLTRKWFGSTFDEEFSSADDIRKALYSDKPNLRKLALLAVLFPDWNGAAGPEQLSYIEKMTVDDQDKGVRSTALRVLGGLSSGSRDTRIGALLAGVVRNDAEDRDCRSAAYSALLELLGRPPEPGESHFPDLIDWELVDSFLRGDQ